MPGLEEQENDEGESDTLIDNKSTKEEEKREESKEDKPEPD